MDMQAVLKAGAVGVGILFVLTLLGLIPCVGCLTLPLTVITYVGVGVLAAYWMTQPRSGSSGAMNGALAAVVAAFIASVLSGIVNSIYFSISGVDPIGEAITNLPPDQLAALQEAGIDPAMLGGLGIAGILSIAAVCCVIWLVVAAALGAAGGAYWGNSHQN